MHLEMTSKWKARSWFSRQSISENCPFLCFLGCSPYFCVLRVKDVQKSLWVVGLPWGHVYFCVGVRLTGLTVQALTKLAVSEPVPMASFIIRSFCNRSKLEEKFLKLR